MHAFGVALDHRWTVVDHLLQARKANHPECIARACAGRNIDTGSLGRQFLFAVNDRVSALRFTLKRKPHRKCLAKLPRNIEKLSAGSAFELKLDLAQWL